MIRELTNHNDPSWSGWIYGENIRMILIFLILATNLIPRVAPGRMEIGENGERTVTKASPSDCRLSDWMIEWCRMIYKDQCFPSDRGKRQKFSKEFKTTTRWLKAMINSPFAASIFVICVCYSAPWTVFEILTLPINPRTVIFWSDEREANVIYIYQHAHHHGRNIFTIWSRICLFCLHSSAKFS